MKVFVPHEKDRNIYFDEIIKFSDCKYVFGDYRSSEIACDIVNIQFPEAIFNWIPPTQDQLNDLEEKIIMWKEIAKIVYTLNDIESHYDIKNEYIGLFKLLQKYVDGVIHLGHYSLEKYKSLFSNSCSHTVIYHPLYESLLNKNVKESFQKSNKVDFGGKFIVSAIGSIRSKEEADLLLKIFKRIPVKNKILIVPNMRLFVDLTKFRPYRLRNIYYQLYERIFCFPLTKDQYLFGNKFIEYNQMVDLVKSSSLIIIPRLKNLNSGNLYLGLTFDIPMVIPKIGNLTEIGEYFGFPMLDLDTENYKEILPQITSKEFKDNFLTQEYLKKKEIFSSRNISVAYKSFFEELLADNFILNNF